MSGWKPASLHHPTTHPSSLALPLAACLLPPAGLSCSAAGQRSGVKSRMLPGGIYLGYHLHPCCQGMRAVPCCQQLATHALDSLFCLPGDEVASGSGEQHRQPWGSVQQWSMVWESPEGPCPGEQLQPSLRSATWGQRPRRRRQFWAPSLQQPMVVSWQPFYLLSLQVHSQHLPVSFQALVSTPVSLRFVTRGKISLCCSWRLSGQGVAHVAPCKLTELLPFAHP